MHSMWSEESTSPSKSWNKKSKPSINPTKSNDVKMGKDGPKTSSSKRGSDKASFGNTNNNPPSKNTTLKTKPGRTSFKQSSSGNGSITVSASKSTPKKVSPSNTSPKSNPSSASTRHLPRKGQCEICKQECRTHCAGCRMVFYCCRQHQQADWSSHKLICRPFSIPTQYSSGFLLKPPGVSGTSSSTSSIKSSSVRGSSASLEDASGTGAELQFMISTKEITPGFVLCTEKPLFVTANIFTSKFRNASTSNFCVACLHSTPEARAFPCGKCGTVPLCADCFHDKMNGNSKKFLPGQGHSTEECSYLAQFVQKFSEALNFKSSKSEEENREKFQRFVKDLAVLRVLFFRTLLPWRWESVIAFRASPRFTACCKHNIGLEDWLASDFSVSNLYFKTICKEKAFPLLDIVKVIAVFCEKAVQDQSLLVLYENRSWIAHACTPNAELFHRPKSEDSNLEIVVKSVAVIREGSKVFLNYMTDFEGGRSTLALKLFQKSGLYCCDTRCECHGKGFDKSLGLRCDLVFTTSAGATGFSACAGIVSPEVEGPNPAKPNLGLSMFFKSKKWECDKCKKTEKYAVLQPKIMEIAQDLASGCDACYVKNKGKNFLHLQSRLLAHLSNEHWMVWKARLRILKVWSDSIGYGPAMLKSAVSFPPTSALRDNLLQIAKHKADLYGSGIYDIPEAKGRKPKPTKMSLLEFIGKRYGPHSPHRGELLLDAFYANLILLIEDYKRELPLPSGSAVKAGQIASETCRKLGALRNLLEEAVESLKVGEGVISNTSFLTVSNYARHIRMGTQCLEAMVAVCGRVRQAPTSVMSYMNDLVGAYACQDVNFLDNCLKPSQPRRDPLAGLDLQFESDSANIFAFASYKFGATTSNPSSPRSPSKTKPFRYFSFDDNYPEFDSPFGFFGTDSDVDDNDDGGDPLKFKANTKSRANKNSSKTEDWSSYFDLSSDDDIEDDNFGLDEPDIFDDDALEELAEWAALQFMMGKMNV